MRTLGNRLFLILALCSLSVLRQASALDETLNSLTEKCIGNALSAQIKNDADYEAEFTKKSAELEPEDFSGISKMAQSKDQPTDSVNVEADKLSQQQLNDFRARADKTRQNLEALKRKGQVKTYDVAVVGGAGVHGGEFITALQALAPGADIIGIDAGDGTHATFDSDFFHLNSSNGPDLDDTPLLYSPNQLRDLMPDVQGHVYPRARALANGNHSELGSFDTDFLLSQGVVSAVKDPDGYFTVTTKSGLQIRARKLVAAVGYGPTRTGFMDPDSQALVNQSIADLKNGKTQGIAVPFDDLRKKNEADRAKEQALARKESRPVDTSYQHVLDHSTEILVGGGDGGAVVAEQKKGKIIWLGQKGDNGADYITTVGNKKRYGDLIPLIDNHEIEPTPGHLSSIKKIQVDGVNKIEATYTDPSGASKKVVGDVLVLATGYDAVADVFSGMTPHYFSNGNDPEIKGVWDLAKAREKGFYEVKHPELAGKSTAGFYSVGVYGYNATGMPSVSPGSGVTIQIAKEIAADVKLTHPVTSIAPAEGAQTRLTADMSAVPGRNIQEPKIALAGAKVELLRETHAFSFGQSLRLSVQFSSGKATFEIDGLAPDSSKLLLQKLTANTAFLDYLRDYGKTSGTLSFQIPKTDAGGLRMDRAQITYSGN